MRGRSIVVWAFVAALLMGVQVHAVNTASRYLNVTTSGIKVPVPNAQVRMKMGQRLPFIQETRDAYIALYEDLQGQRLAAFPKQTKKRDGVAWLTKDYEIVFAKNVRSIEADLYLVAGENINIMDQTREGYEVIIVRNEYRIPITLPLDTKGLVLHEPEAAAERVVRAEQTQKTTERKVRRTAKKATVMPKTTTPPVKRSLPPPPQNTTIKMAKDTKPASKGIKVEFEYPDIFPPEPETTEAPPEDLLAEETRLPSPTDDSAAPEGEELAAVPGTNTEMVVASTSTTEVALLDIDTGATVTSSTHATETAGDEETVAATDETALTEEPEEVDLGPMLAPPTPREGGFLQYLTINWTTLQIIILFIMAEGYIYWRHKKHRGEGSAPKATTYATSFSSVGESTGHMFMQADAEDDKHFSGQLGSFPMGQLLQFLHNAKETGTLSVTNSADSTISQLFLDNGEIINAFSVDKTGIDAVHNIETIKSGTFTFTRGEIEAEHRVIQESTEDILLSMTGDPIQKAAAKFDLKSFLNRKKT